MWTEGRRRAAGRGSAGGQKTNIKEAKRRRGVARGAAFDYGVAKRGHCQVAPGSPAFSPGERPLFRRRRNNGRNLERGVAAAAPRAAPVAVGAGCASPGPFPLALLWTVRKPEDLPAMIHSSSGKYPRPTARSNRVLRVCKQRKERSPISFFHQVIDVIDKGRVPI